MPNLIEAKEGQANNDDPERDGERRLAATHNTSMPMVTAAGAT